MNVRFEPINVAARENGPGMLVYANDWLVGVLVQLSSMHNQRAGSWFLEAGFGYFAERDQPIFLDIPEAEEWFRANLIDFIRYHPVSWAAFEESGG